MLSGMAPHCVSAWDRRAGRQGSIPVAPPSWEVEISVRHVGRRREPRSCSDCPLRRRAVCPSRKLAQSTREEQQGMIEAIVETIFPGIPRTWEWLSQGGGRVDRLSLWVGAISSKDERRCIRMGTKNIIAKIEGKKNNSKLKLFGKLNL